MMAPRLTLWCRHGYDLDAIHRLPDTFCMGWHTSPVSAEFACNLAREVLRAMQGIGQGLHSVYTQPQPQSLYAPRTQRLAP